jgi:hypothetical protein
LEATSSVISSLSPSLQAEFAGNSRNSPQYKPSYDPSSEKPPSSIIGTNIHTYTSPILIVPFQSKNPHVSQRPFNLPRGAAVMTLTSIIDYCRTYLRHGVSVRIKISGRLSTTFFSPNFIATTNWSRLKTPSTKSLFSSCFQCSHRYRKHAKTNPSISFSLIWRRRCVCSVGIPNTIQLELLVVLDPILGTGRFIATGEAQVVRSAFPEPSTHLHLQLPLLHR